MVTLNEVIWLFTSPKGKGYRDVYQSGSQLCNCSRHLHFVKVWKMWRLCAKYKNSNSNRWPMWPHTVKSIGCST